jgi:uncharacterized protein YidB (DUF937 family)
MPALTRVLEEMLGGMPPQAAPDSSASLLRGLFFTLFQGVPDGRPSTGVGGLQGLFARFRAAHLADIPQSWISDGPKLPVTPEQLRHVLGEERVQLMAAQAGLTPQQLLGQLSQFLPGVVSRLAPHGRVPDPQDDPTLR